MKNLTFFLSFVFFLHFSISAQTELPVIAAYSNSSAYMHDVSLAVDADVNTYWESGNNNDGNYITLDLGSTVSKPVNLISITSSTGVFSYQIQLSTNNSTWTSVKSGSGSSSFSASINNPTIYRYIKIIFSGRVAAYPDKINNIEVYCASDLSCNKLNVYQDASFYGSLNLSSITANGTATSTIGSCIFNNGTTRDLVLRPYSSSSKVIFDRGTINFNTHATVATEKIFTIGDNATAGRLKFFNTASLNSTFADFKGTLYFRRWDAPTNTNLGSIMGLQSDGTVTIGIWEKYDNTLEPTFGNKLKVGGGIWAQSLTVNGVINAKEVIVTETVPSSDYVFENDYNLKALSEVEKFVKENKHLPEVPSAKEFKEKGCSVGEMQDILLRKVEELTLYMIEQNKLVKAQDDKIKIQSEQIKELEAKLQQLLLINK